MQALLSKFKSGLQRTKTKLVRSIQSAFSDTETWTEESYDELEAALIGADLGVDIATRLVDDIRDRYDRGEIETTADIIATAKAYAIAAVGTESPLQFAPSGPTIILMVGVNGSGKTTTTGKLAHRWKQEGKSVMLAACDTFRAAAVEQLKIWATRVDCPIIASHPNAHASAVAYDACKAALSRDVDVLLIDTAGRQHTRRGLMEELGKIRRTINKACPGAPHEVWLVVDGSTGTNALQQAREFGRVAEITGLCLTKLDGSSKGGVVVAIRNEFSIPIHFVGLGEGVDDLQPFDAAMFADALFSDQ